MTKRVVLVRHNDDPADDRVVAFLKAKGVDSVTVRPFKGEALPEAGQDIAGTVIYGGPFSVFEEESHPFLNDEARWIGQCMRRGIPLLGICQGAQQIARVLGAEVGPKPDELTEFGYYEIRPTEQGRGIFPESLHVAQSHYHEFQCPAGAERLAGSGLFANQAFRVGENVYGFQFHAEVTPQGFRRWQQAPWARYGMPGVQTREQQDELLALHDKAQHDWFMGFLERLFGPALAA